MKRLSVIIPGYKTPHAWWKRCVESVCKAAGANDEIILVDDGCFDSYLDELARADDRMRVIHRENGGLSVARNTALEVAQGEYVAFVDSDDEVTKDVFEDSLRELEMHRADVAVFGVKVVWVEDGLAKVDVLKTQFLGCPQPQDIVVVKNACLLNYSCNKIFRKTFLDTHGLRFEPKGMPCEDIVFNLSVLLAGSRWCTIENVGYVYYRTRSTLLSQYRKFNDDGLRLGCEAWRKYCQTSHKANELFHCEYNQSETQFAWAAWYNLWRTNSPYTLKMKYEFLKERQDVLKISPLKVFLKTFIFKFLRKHFYIRPIRRWHVKRLYPQAQNWAPKQ